MSQSKLRFLPLLLIVFVCLLAPFTQSCSKRPKRSGLPDEPLTEHSYGGRRMDSFTFLKLCMQGEFASTQQSKVDSSFFDIRLRMVEIWQASKDQFYLYVEQAVATSQDKPYRQRIYKVKQLSENTFVSHIYTINQPERFVGKKGDDAIFSSFSPDSLTIKEGCEVYLTYDPVRFKFNGATKEKQCPSDRSGASYASSVVEIDEEKMVSWDQGWDASGKQVWGSTKGGYIFIKNR